METYSVRRLKPIYDTGTSTERATDFGGISTDTRCIGWRATAGSTDVNELISGFQAALEQEIEAVSNDKAGGMLRIRSGERIHHDAQHSVYRFSTNEITIPDDAPIEATINGKSVTGFVVATDLEGVNIAFEEDLGEYIQDVHLKRSDETLLKSQKEKLEQVASGQLKLNVSGCMKLFGFIRPGELNRPIQPVALSSTQFQPNNYQIDAITRSLSQELTFIWGPPGTGKTKTLSIILSQLVQAGKRVLLVSHTNLAVDEVLLRYAEEAGNSGSVDEGKIIRCGNPTRNEPELHALTLNNVVERVSSVLLQNIAALTAENEALEEKRQKLNDPELMISQSKFARIQKQIAQVLGEIEKLKLDRTSTEKDLSKTKEDLHAKQKSLEDLENAGFLRRMFGGTTRETLVREIKNLKTHLKTEQDNLASIDKKLRDAEERKVAGQNTLSEAQRELETLFEPLGLSTTDLSSRPDIDKYRLELREQIECNNNRITQLRTKIEGNRKDILQNAQVIGCTLTKAFLDAKIYNERFDTVILDEASMAPLPTVFFATGLARTDHYIVSGDFRQLPPIARSRDEAANRWLHRDIFTQAGITQIAGQNIPDERLAMLKEQHRMHPDIVQVINKPMYAGQLETSEYARQEKPKITARPPFEGYALVCIDTSQINPWCKQTPLDPA